MEFIEDDFKSTIKEELKEKKWESPRFEYKGVKYSRPELAKKVISDYIDNYKERNSKEITFDKLKNNLFPGKKPSKSFPIATIEDAPKADYRNNGTKIYDNYGYYPESKEIADAKIRFYTGCDEKELEELLKKAGVGLTLDEMRIK